MSDRDLKAKAARAGVEYEQTEAAFAKVRADLIDKLLKTAIGESLLRDKLVLTIQALDAVQQELLTVAASGAILDHAAENPAL
jgi:hypothetical protein